MKFIVYALGAALAAGCASSSVKDTPDTVAPVYAERSPVQEIMLSAGEKNVTSHNHGNSDYAVAIIREEHNNVACQVQNYRTLEKLLPDTKFLAAEGGMGGPVKHTALTPDGKSSIPKELDLETLNQRKAVVNGWIKKGTLPYKREVAHVEAMLGKRPQHATALIEYVYQDDVTTISVDDRELKERSLDLIKSGNSLGQRINYFAQIPVTKDSMDNLLGAITMYRFVGNLIDTVLMDERSYGFVRNITANARKIKKGDIVPFPVGALHSDVMEKQFKEEGISYVVIENEACKEAVEKILVEKEKQDQKLNKIEAQAKERRAAF